MRALNQSISNAVLVSLAAACTPHEPALTPPPAPSPEPAIVQELEPVPDPPARIAPTLPPLAPKRPLAQLELRWTNYDQQDRGADPLWSVGTQLAPIPEALATVLGLGGPPEPRDSLPLDDIVRRAGPLVLALAPDRMTAYEAGHEGLRWDLRNEEGARSYLHYVGERVLLAVRSDAAGDTLGAWALEDGRRLWLRTPGGPNEFERIRELGGEASEGWGWMLHEGGFESFDLLSGQTRWTTPVETDCGVVVGEGQIIIERSTSYRVLEPDTGAEREEFPARTRRRCAWSDYTLPAGVIEGNRLLNFENPSDLPTQLWSYPLGGEGESWRATTNHGTNVLAADHDAVYVASPDELGLVALDAQSGAPVYEFGFGEWFEVQVQPVGGEAGPVVLVHGEQGVDWLFARGEQASPPEPWEIRGRLVSDGYLDKRRLKGVRLEVGGVVVKTDKRGRFVARGSGRGVVQISMVEDEDSYDPSGGSRVEFEPALVRLDGSERYEAGDISTYEGWYE